MRRKIQVLIVEDEPPTMRFIQMLTGQEEEFEVAKNCESAEEALLYLQMGGKPDLIITDIRMAEMSGLDFLKKVRKTNREIRLIIISGYKMFEYAKEGIRLHIEDYITKPIDPEEFHRVLGRVRKYYEEESVRKMKECLTKALENKEEEKAREILKNYTKGMLFIYQSAESNHTILFENECPNKALAVPYKDCVLIFWSGMEAEREKKKLEIALSKQEKKGTFLMVWIEERGVEIVQTVRKIYDKIQGLIIPGECKSIHKNSAKELLTDIAQNTEELKNSCMYIQGENWNEVKRSLEKLFKKWETDRTPLGEIRRETKLLGEYFRKSEKLKVNDTAYHEEIDYCLRNADSYGELIDEMGGFYEELLEPVTGETQKGVKKEREIVESIIALVEKNMQKNYSLAEISDFYGLSQPYIRKLFKKYTDNSYNKYVLERKITFAKQMMDDNPEVLIKDVADALGYDPFYFSTVFSRNTGLTPSEYKSKLEERGM